MKRHKYSLRKNFKIDKNKLRTHIVLSFFKCTRLKGFSECARFVLAEPVFALSKVGSFCLITGRVRFSFVLTASSRHMFFELTSAGLNTGFFMSSW